MDWNNVDLNSGYERDQNIIDPLSFDTLLLEINCNIRTENLDKKHIREQFEEDLRSRIESSREIFNANIDNIYSKAKEERSQP